MPKRARESKRQLMLHKLEALAQSTMHSPEAQAAKTKIEQLKVHRVIVQVAPATERSPGEVVYGHYFVENGDTVVMCDSEGVPLHHREVRRRVELKGDQNAEQVARRLTREMHQAGDAHGGFYRPLRYPKTGIV